jgi:hypothetical protein
MWGNGMEGFQTPLIVAGMAGEAGDLLCLWACIIGDGLASQQAEQQQCCMSHRCSRCVR